MFTLNSLASASCTRGNYNIALSFFFFCGCLFVVDIINHESFEFNLRLSFLHLVFIFHFLLLSISLRQSKSLTSPLVVFIFVVIMWYLVKFLIIELYSDVDVHFVSLTDYEYNYYFYKSLFYITAGTSFFWIGYNINYIDFIVKYLPSIQFTPRMIQGLKFCALILIIISFMAVYSIINQKGGFASALSRMNEFRIAGEDYGGFLHVLNSYLIYGILIGIVYFLSSYWNIKILKLFFIICLFFVGFLLFTATGSRSIALSALICFIVIYENKILRNSYKQKKTRKIFLIIILLIVCFIFIDIMRVFRGTGTDFNEFKQRISQNYENKIQSVGRSLNGPSGIISALVLVPETIYPTFGATFIKGLLKPLPSTLIPFFTVTKDTIGNRIARHVSPERFAKGGGFAISIYGLFYLNFMFPGIVILSFLLGLFCRLAQIFISSLTNHDSFNASFYAVFLSIFLIGFFRTGSILHMSTDLFFLIIIFIILLFANKIAYVIK